MANKSYTIEDRKAVLAELAAEKADRLQRLRALIDQADAVMTEGLETGVFVEGEPGPVTMLRSAFHTFRLQVPAAQG